VEARRELARLLVEEISVACGEDGRPRGQITYRFGPTSGEPSLGKDLSAHGVRNSEEFAKAQGRGGSEGLLRERPRMSSYEVAAEREPEAQGSDKRSGLPRLSRD
jgi:hypothetical protein